MASDSVIAASMALYDTLTAANFPGGVRPSVYFDMAPQVDGGVQIRPPVVVLKDKGGSPTYDMEANGIEEGSFDLEVYADSLADVDAIVKAVRFNGQNPNVYAGFDFGTLDMNPPWYHIRLQKGQEQRFIAGVGKSGQRVHGCRLEYQVLTQVRGTG